jgi:hypothetical protein
MVLFWLGPLGLDLIRAVNSGLDNAPVIAHLSTFSPVGVLIDAWGEGRVDPTIGVVAQLVVAAAIAALYYSTGRRARLALPEPAAVAGA